MRKIGRVFGILLAVILVVTSFASGVFADSDAEITNYGENEYYNWYYYSDKFLDVGVKAGQCYAPLEELPAYILDEVESVMVFVNEQELQSLWIDGAGCNASSLLIRGDGKIHYNILTVSNFPNVVDGSKFVIPEGDRVTTLSFDGFNFTSLDFLDNFNVYSLSLVSCNKLTDVVMPLFRGVSFANCENLKKAKVSSTTTIFHFHDCSSLLEVHLPNGLGEICTDSFDNCVLLSDIYFDGTIDEWEKIKVLDHYDPTDLKADSVIGGAQKHFKVLTGWVQDGNKWVYYDEYGTLMRNQWINENGRRYYVDEDSYMVTGWLSLDGSWYYFNAGGDMVTGWKQIGGKWYYFDAFGEMVSNVACEIGGKVYVFDSNGAMVNSGWFKLYDASNGNTAWFYCASNGVAATGWKQFGGKWYYFYETGSMAEFTWITEGGYKYFLDSDGSMFTGWKRFGEYWYFFKADGRMASNEYCQGYWLNGDGTWTYKAVASWKKDGTGWWYGDSTGWYAKSASYTIDGKVYNFNASGYCTNP